MIGAASVRRSWILSYAAVLAVPILVSLFVASATHRVLQDQIRDSGKLVVELLGKELEGRLAYVLRLVSDVASHPLTDAVLEGPGRDEGSFRSDLVTLADALAAQGSYDRHDDFFFLSITRSGGILLPRAYYSFEEFYGFHFEGTLTDSDRLLRLLRGRQDNSTIPLEFIDPFGRRRLAVAFIKSLPPQSTEPLGAVAVLLDSQSLVDSLHSVVQARDLEIRILDRDGELLLSSLGSDSPGEAVSTGEQGGMVALGGGRFVSTWKAIPALGWTLQLLSPAPQVWERLWWVQAGTLVGLALSLGFGVWLTAYWMRKHYQPVRRILDELSRRTGSSPSAAQNEFLSIETGLIQAFEERYQALQRFEENKGPLRENLVSRMLRGASEPGQGWEPSLAALGMDWAGNEFLVVIAEGDENDRESTVPRRERCLAALARVVGELGSVWPSASLDEALFVINAFPRPGACLAIAQALSRAELPFAPLQSAVAVGWESLPAALEQARAVRDHRYSSAGERVLSFGELPADQAAQPYPLTGALEEKFLNALRAGDEGAALEVLEAVASPGLRALAPQEARYLVGDLGACFLKALPQAALGAEPRQELYAALDSIAGRRTVEDSLQGLRLLVGETCSGVRARQARLHDKQRSEAARRLALKVRAYLESRYRDPMLTLTGIAEELGYSAAYLSSFFKESQAEGLMETLARIRLDRAKVLLGESEAPLAAVAQDCGFSDVNTFIRSFKKFFGITPGKYRESLG